MKRIGIITVFKNVNYGSKLQSFALQKKLKDLGYHGENLSYQLERSANKRSRLLSLINKPTLLLKIPYRRKYHRRYEIFKSFLNNNINISEFSVENILDGENDIEQKYHKFICGSDQIWAPNQFSEYFFLSFVSDKSKKMAYAPSIGLPEIPDDLVDKYRKLINDIPSLSIREKDGAEIIKEITGREVPVVVDPTLLLNGDEWRNLAIKYKEKSPYILCYFLGSNKEHRKWVENLSERTGYDIIVLPFATRDFYWGDKKIFEAGPSEFLGLVDGAEIVCTDSYHGMLFSLNMNTEFYSFLRFKEGEKLNQNSRVLNFLTKLDLKNRIVDLNKRNQYENINWIEVNSKIDKERVKSIEFLEKTLLKCN